MTNKSLQFLPFKKTPYVAYFNNANGLRQKKQALILMQDNTSKLTYS